MYACMYVWVSVYVCACASAPLTEADFFVGIKMPNHNKYPKHRGVHVSHRASWGSSPREREDAGSSTVCKLDLHCINQPHATGLSGFMSGKQRPFYVR